MINIFNIFSTKIWFGLKNSIGLEFGILFDITNMYILYLWFNNYMMDYQLSGWN